MFLTIDYREMICTLLDLKKVEIQTVKKDEFVNNAWEAFCNQIHLEAISNTRLIRVKTLNVEQYCKSMKYDPPSPVSGLSFNLFQCFDEFLYHLDCFATVKILLFHVFPLPWVWIFRCVCVCVCELDQVQDISVSIFSTMLRSTFKCLNNLKMTQIHHSRTIMQKIWWKCSELSGLKKIPCSSFQTHGQWKSP